ncbi:MAG: RNA 2',3'-cyclic phosphodiesterase [Acidobacteria bacterium]|nr:MAG: RNA 2',3'-cyclic phosphodiesterase [Acidobacteriota bacterium]
MIRKHTMRVFIAIDLGHEARAAIATEQKKVARRVGGPGIRFVQPEHLHVTLAFVDRLADAQVARLVADFSEAFPVPAFELVFGGLGVFPERGAPRALWLGIARGVEETVALQRLVAARLHLVGIEPEHRPFRPHHRPKGVPDSSAVAATHVEGVTTYQSRPTPSGPSYTVLTEARLRTGEAPI